MEQKGCFPIEVSIIHDFKDRDLAIRCLEVIRPHVPAILGIGAPAYAEVIALCHHFAWNIYPALGLFDADEDSVSRFGEEEGAKIIAWVNDKGGLDWLIAESHNVEAKSWEELKGPGHDFPTDMSPRP